MITKEQAKKARKTIYKCKRILKEYSFQQSSSEVKKIISLKRGDYVLFKSNNDEYTDHGLKDGEVYTVSSDGVNSRLHRDIEDMARDYSINLKDHFNKYYTKIPCDKITPVELIKNGNDYKLL
jgi:hypothetical protein